MVARFPPAIYARVMSEFEEHPSRVATWRDGRFVVLPDAVEEDCTVWFPVDRGRDHAIAWEGLLARRTGPDRAVVCAVPFWLYDVNLGDEVVLRQRPDGADVADAVVRDGGNYTFRVAFSDARDDDDRWRRLMVDLATWDCWFDVRGPAYVAISVPAAHAQAVADLLAAREAAGELVYETGRSTPPTLH